MTDKKLTLIVNPESTFELEMTQRGYQVLTLPIAQTPSQLERMQKIAKFTGYDFLVLRNNPEAYKKRFGQ